jgi:hypothetical protein
MASEQVQNRSKREMFQYEQPAQAGGFSDLLENHPPGMKFQYLVLNTDEEESYTARVKRLMTLKPRTGKEALKVEEVPEVPLINDSTEYSLDDFLPRKGKKYIRLARMTVIFIPLSSVMDVFTRATICLVDQRMLKNQARQEAIVGTNMDNRMDASLDYCIPRTSAGKVKLVVHKEQAIMEEGEQWASIKVQVKVEEADFPYMSDFKEVIAVNAAPRTLLAEFDRNPNRIDMTITQDHLKTLKHMHMSNEITEASEALTSTKGEMQYAASAGEVLKRAQKGKKVQQPAAEGWDFLADRRKPDVPVDQLSQNSFAVSDGEHTQEPEPVSKADELPVRPGIPPAKLPANDARPPKHTRGASGVFSIEETLQGSDDGDSDVSFHPEPQVPVNKKPKKAGAGVSFNLKDM